MQLNKSTQFGDILLSNIEIKKLFAFLKCQIHCNIIFINSQNELYFDEFIIKNRGKNGLYISNFENENQFITYQELLSNFSEIISLGYSLNIVLEQKIYNDKFQLINLISQNTINPDIIENCIFIDYNKEVFQIQNKNLPDGSSDKVYYFERNDTILVFSELGPELITENESINSIIDIICI